MLFYGEFVVTCGEFVDRGFGGLWGEQADIGVWIVSFCFFLEG